MAVRVKRALTEDTIPRLRREAEILATVRHPGVVELVEVVDDVESVSIRMTALDGSPLAEADPLDVEEIAGLMAAVTTTLADLHALGIVHGNLDATHVIVTPDGSPVLCGFGSARRVGEGADPADDVRAVGRIIGELLAHVDGDGGRRGRHLAAIARGATDAPPPAAVLAGMVAARIDGSCLPGTERAVERSAPPAALGDLLRRPRRRRLVPRLAGLLAAVAFVATAASLLRGSTPEPPPLAVADDPVPSTTTTTAAPVAVRVWPTSTTAPPLVSDGTIVHNGERWLVGDPGDIVTTGDWGCTGVETVALLRPTSGEVYVFRTWDDDVAPTAVGRVAGATALEASDRNGDGCDELVVMRTTGDPVVVDA